MIRIDDDFKELAKDLKEQIFDCEPDILLECEECHNTEDFIIGFNIVYMGLEKDSNKIISLNGETRIHKPTDIIFICKRCKKIILESCMY